MSAPVAAISVAAQQAGVRAVHRGGHHVAQFVAG
jgi:hypothetical protein